MKAFAGSRAPMKVVLFATRFAFEYSIELSNHLIAREEVATVDLFLPEGFVSAAQLEQLDKSVGFHSFALPSNKKALSMWRSFDKTLRKIRQLEPDIVHVQGAAHPYFWLHYGKIKHIPVVDTVHDAEPHPGFGNFLQAYMRHMGVRHAKRWFIHGENLKEVFHRINPGIDKNDIIVIPKGHYGIFDKYAEERHEEEPRTVLFFGNITKYKGIDVLIEAAKEVIDQVPDVKFIVAGRVRKKDKEPIDLSFVKENAHFELLDYRLSEKEVSDVYQRAGFLVLPYIEASNSGVMSIAFGMGKAVVASRVGALPEIIEHEQNGLLVEPGSAPDLSAAIIRLLKDDDLRKKLAREALEYAREHLSWEEVAQKSIDQYQEIITK